MNTATVTQCGYGRCTSGASHLVSITAPAITAQMTVEDQTTTRPMCSKHRFAADREQWGFGIVTWEQI